VTGKLVRSPRPGFASGRWNTDVSRWVAGWIIGVEWDPFATLATNKKNPHAPAENGRHFYSTPSASPAERWIAGRMNEFQATSTTIGGIGLTLAADGGPAAQAGTVRWQNWQAVRYTERIKPGAPTLRQAFSTCQPVSLVIPSCLWR
jgi:hypothetical protein